MIFCSGSALLFLSTCDNVWHCGCGAGDLVMDSSLGEALPADRVGSAAPGGAQLVFCQAFDGFVAALAWILSSVRADASRVF